VLASFFVRAASGQYQLDDPEHLLKLLVAMARNKLAFRTRKHQAARRNPLQVVGGNSLLETVAQGPTPDQAVSARDLLHEVRRRLTAKEQRLAELRGLGQTWEQISGQLGGTAEGHRIQLVRGLDRVSRQLGLDEVGDG
jgi:DNA-directed RNA polymerase specialized sigma24 family protein